LLFSWCTVAAFDSSSWTLLLILLFLISSCNKIGFLLSQARWPNMGMWTERQSKFTGWCQQITSKKFCSSDSDISKWLVCNYYNLQPRAAKMAYDWTLVGQCPSHRITRTGIKTFANNADTCQQDQSLSCQLSPESHYANLLWFHVSWFSNVRIK
jgi:hypothetical protein